VETALYPVAASDDQRSYGTYDKNMDDFSDDFNREYEVRSSIHFLSVAWMSPLPSLTIMYLSQVINVFVCVYWRFFHHITSLKVWQLLQ
jgi:hypothetical protein